MRGPDSSRISDNESKLVKYNMYIPNRRKKLSYAVSPALTEIVLTYVIVNLLRCLFKYFIIIITEVGKTQSLSLKYMETTQASGLSGVLQHAASM